MKPSQGFDYAKDARAKGKVTGRAGFGDDMGTGQISHLLLGMVVVTVCSSHLVPNGPSHQAHTKSLCMCAGRTYGIDFDVVSESDLQ